MDNAELAHIFDAITGGTCAERFLNTLAAPSHSGLPQSDFPITAPPFDMPLVAAQGHTLFDQPPFPSVLSPPILPHHQLLENPAFGLEHNLPVSAVTGASYRSSSPSSVQAGIRKKRIRTGRVQPDTVAALSAAVTAPNVSFSSDVSLSTVEHSSPHSLPSAASLHHRPPLRLPPQSKTEPQLISPVQTNPVPAPLQGPSPATNKPIGHRASSSPSSHGAPKSHTRKCREKVTKQFENLLEVLPRPSNGTEVKHKAQILEYTIRTFKSLLLRRTALQTEIALASRDSLRQWMTATLNTSSEASKSTAKNEPPSISAILQPFVGLYCVKMGWTYGELWLVDSETQQATLATCVFNSEHDDTLKRFNSFSSESRERYETPSKVTNGMVGRAAASGRPEWLNELASDASVFCRADLAQKHGIPVAQAVPVLIHGKRCAAVLVFADVKEHAFSIADMSSLFDYARNIGEFYVEYANGLGRGMGGGQKVKSEGLAGSHETGGAGATGNVRCKAEVQLMNGVVAPGSETSSRLFGDSSMGPKG